MVMQMSTLDTVKIIISYKHLNKQRLKKLVFGKMMDFIRLHGFLEETIEIKNINEGFIGKEYI